MIYFLTSIRNKMQLLFLISATLLLVAAMIPKSAAVKWHDCGSTNGKILNVTIPGCENSARCSLKHGTNQTVSVTFTAAIRVTALKAKVYGQIGPVSVPFPLPYADACQHSNLTCPLLAGQSYTYSAAIYVDPAYPTIQVVVKWELIDQTGQATVCFQVPVQIVSGSISKMTPGRFINIQDVNL